LVLQQIYGVGVGATLLKTENHEFNIGADLHYEAQQFDATADVSELNLYLIRSSLTEAYSRRWGRSPSTKNLPPTLRGTMRAPSPHREIVP
jgi:hypothetical protein